MNIFTRLLLVATSSLLALTIGMQASAHTGEDHTTTASASIAGEETPSKVKGLSIDKRFTKRIKLNWSGVDGATKYQVRVLNKNKKVLKKYTVTKSKKLVKGLKADKTYKFKVRAKNSSGFGEYSKIVKGTTKPVSDTIEEVEEEPVVEEEVSESTTHVIDIAGFAYDPESKTINVGDTVQWTNSDSAAHTVTSNDGNDVFNSGTMLQGETFEVTFTEAGEFEYDYFCAFHTFMQGVVITVE